MRTAFAGFVCGTIGSLVAACYIVPSTSPPPPPKPVVAAAPVESPQVTHGRYIATLSGCTTCHSPLTAKGARDDARLLAGGFEVRLASGAEWHSPNITPDRDTGIGTWSDAQLVAAIREGRAPDGHALSPIMPSAFYARMTDEDVMAVVAYLRAQPAIANKVDPCVGLILPPVELAPQVAADDRGAYLATLMHCGACHGDDYGGGRGFELPDGRGVVAANLTNDTTGLYSWSDEDIAYAVRTMKTKNGEMIRGPMAMYRDDWAKLSPRDMQALVRFIRSVPPVTHDIPERRPTVSLTP